ncbi:hypothetical protein BHYA_0169g00070 [Botrytis hyacinthi]|uniref:Uncharacterized protein n=1 Tax=Botrytis hyacinthi TaxID=278943 RepID=A0A4Z1GN98_9HELO|nr:hypothetical protein BHYA_0169g00070 [Botrytis hyacinthi]
MTENEKIEHRAKRVIVQQKSLAKRSGVEKEADLKDRREMNREKAKVRIEEEWQERRGYAKGWKAAERDRQRRLVDDLRGDYERRMVKT